MVEPRQDYISWDECFARMALVIAQRSKDPSTQAGAIIVDRRNVIVGAGYNGWPRGIAADALPWERSGDLADTKYAYVCHAEENAVYNANNHTTNCVVYCTLFPCNECAKTIIQSGITEVVYLSDKYHDQPAAVAARRLLDLAGVKYRAYQMSDIVSQKPDIGL